MALKSPWLQKMSVVLNLGSRPPSHHIHVVAAQRWRRMKPPGFQLVPRDCRGKCHLSVRCPSTLLPGDGGPVASSALSSSQQKHFITLTLWYAKWRSAKHGEVTSKLTEGIIRYSRHTSAGRALTGSENAANGAQARRPTAVHPTTAPTPDF